MAIAYASAAGASLPNLGSASLVITKPSGTVSGDLLLCFIVLSANQTVTPPSDTVPWNTTVNASGVKGYWKVAGSSEPASYTFTRGLITNTIVGSMVRITGAHPTAPIDQAAAQAGGSGTSIVIPTLTAGSTATYLFEIAASLTASTFTPPGTTTEDYDTQFATESFGVAGGHEVISAGATGTRTWTASVTGTRSGIMWSLIPAPVSPTVNAVTATSTAAANAPTVSGAAAIAAVVATATALALAPVVSGVQNQTVSPPAATATAAAQAPAVTATQNPTVAAVVASSTALALAPVVAGYQQGSVAAIVATATALGFAPVVTGSAVVSSVTATATASAVAPVVLVSVNATVNAVTATATALALAPVASVNATVTAVVASATALAVAPVVAGQQQASVAAIAATATALGFAPVLAASAALTSVAATATTQAFAPMVGDFTYDAPRQPHATIKANQNGATIKPNQQRAVLT